jgi:hypothetical protein
LKSGDSLENSLVPGRLKKPHNLKFMEWKAITKLKQFEKLRKIYSGYKNSSMNILFFILSLAAIKEEK